MALLFTIYFFYKTQVLGKNLLSFIPLSNSYASEKEDSADLKTTLDKSNILDKVESSTLYSMESFYKNKYFEILSKYDFSGFNLYFFIPQNEIEQNTELLKKEWGSCVIDDPYIFTLSMALIERQIVIKHEKKYQGILDIAVNCKNKLPKIYSNLLDVIVSKGPMEKSSSLISNSKDELEVIERIKKIRNERIKKYSSTYKFLRLNQEYIMKQPITSPSELFETYKKNKSHDEESSYFNRLSEIILSLQVKNAGWNFLNVEQFIILDPELVIFEAPPLPIWNQILSDLKIENFDIEAMLMMIHDKIDAHFDFQTRPDLKKLFALSLLPLTHLNQDKLIENQSLNLSLVELKKYLNSPTMGKSFPGLWIYYLYSQKEKGTLVSFVDEMNSPSYRKYINDQNYWSVAPLLIAPEKNEEFNNKYIKNSLVNQGPYQKHVFIKLLGKEYFKRLLYLLDEKGAWNRARFQIEREYYKNNLSAGVAIDYSIYRLYKLGDSNPINLWWAVL